MCDFATRSKEGTIPLGGCSLRGGVQKSHTEECYVCTMEKFSPVFNQGPKILSTPHRKVASKVHYMTTVTNLSGQNILESQQRLWS